MAKAKKRVRTVYLRHKHLVALRACPEWRQKFRRVFKNGAPNTNKSFVIAYDKYFPLRWFLNRLSPGHWDFRVSGTETQRTLLRWARPFKKAGGIVQINTGGRFHATGSAPSHVIVERYRDSIVITCDWHKEGTCVGSLRINLAGEGAYPTVLVEGTYYHRKKLVSHPKRNSKVVKKLIAHAATLYGLSNNRIIKRALKEA